MDVLQGTLNKIQDKVQFFQQDPAIAETLVAFLLWLAVYNVSSFQTLALFRKLLLHLSYGSLTGAVPEQSLMSNLYMECDKLALYWGVGL